MQKEICSNCSRYDAYYRQTADSFIRLGHGYCSKSKKQTSRRENCEDFRSNCHMQEQRKKRLLDSLERSLEYIKDISLILKEKEDF